jgi:hypothetical protein
MTPIHRLGWTTLALLALAGCEAPAPPVATPPATGTPGAPSNETKALPVEPDKKEGASVEKLTDEEIAEVKKLPADEQAAALGQVTCPVSGHHLGEGGMGAPIKQTIGDKTFYICCASCKGDVKNHPDEVLAKLKK